MPDTFFEPADAVTFETNIKRSRFIAGVFPCRTEEAVRERLRETCAQHRQANHNCWGYVLEDPHAEHSSDAGEPSGSAGRPILGEIARSSLVNVLVVVTRYFGGVKLGVRGLIEAYGGTAENALAICEPVERVRTKLIKVEFPHGSIGDVSNLLTKAGPEGEMQWHFSESGSVTVEAAFRLSRVETLCEKLHELANRKIISRYVR